jgi:hypothetical protein
VPNPLLQRPTYPWHQLLGKLVHQRLCEGFTTPAAAQLVSNKAGNNPANIRWAAPIKDVWMEILDEAARAGTLAALLSEVLKQQLSQTILDDVRKFFEGAGPVDVLISLLLPGDAPFLDRDNLRQSLRRMTERSHSAVPILLVRGGKGTGKSMTLQLVKSVAEAEGDDAISFHQDNAISLASVVDKLLKRIESGPCQPPPRLTTDAAWYQQIANDAYARAAQRKMRFWIVVDDLSPGADGKPRVDPDVLSFFHQFALQLDDPGFSRHFRMVFLDYPPKGPNHPPGRLKKIGFVEDESSALAAEHIRAYVEAVFNDYQRKYSTADLDAVVAQVQSAAAQLMAADGQLVEAQALNDVLSAWRRGPSWQS